MFGPSHQALRVLLQGAHAERSSLIPTAQALDRRWLQYGLWIASSLLIFWHPLVELVHFAIVSEIASHVVLIPFLSAWVLYCERKQIIPISSYDFPAACAPLLLTIFLAVWEVWAPANWSFVSKLTVYTLALVLVWIAGFAFFFGRAALFFRRFPFLFLFLTVPLPEFLPNQMILFLQKASTELTAALFDLLSVPYLREGFVFHLAHVNIEVAHACSGIRSSTALFILGLLAGHFALRAFWRQATFLVIGVFVMVVKNAVRIVTLTLLASYVDPEFLYGNLHREGGVVFFLLALLMLAPFLWLLQRGEKPRRESTDTTVLKTQENSENT